MYAKAVCLHCLLFALLLAATAGGAVWMFQGRDFVLASYFRSGPEAGAIAKRLHDLRLKYVQARTDEERTAIKASARREARLIDTARLPPELRGWAEMVR